MFEATDAAAPFVWGAGGEQVTPGRLAAQRKIAEAMMQQGMDTSPIRSPWQGLNRVAQSLVGTYQAGRADDDQAAATRDAIASAVAAYKGAQPDMSGAGSVSAAPSPIAPARALVPPAAAAADIEPGKIYRNDEPSPLDPPSGADRDMAIRTIVAEAGNQPFAGQTGVAATFRNRAVDGGYGGDTVPGVIQKPFAYEPWGTPGGRDKMAAIPASDPRYAIAGKALDAAYFGDDPTEGATHFVAPAAQAALGRPMPSWAKGESTTIGDHVFFSPDDAAPSPRGVQVASADPAAIPTAAQPTQGFAIPGQAPPAVSPAVQTVAQAMPAATSTGLAAPVRPGIDVIAKAMSNPFLPPAFSSALASQLKPREVHGQETDAQGNIWDVNRSTGQRTVALKKDPTFGTPTRDADGNLVQRDATGKVTVLSAADKAPTSVSEYKFYKDNFVPTPERPAPMGYDTWSTAKARAGATNITNTIGGEKKGLEEASKLDAEAVRKSQNEIVPALEDADRNFQLMQAAIDRNGGKLPTGGELGKLGLDWARTKDYIAQNWGVDLGSDPTKTTALETLNKGGIKAAGDMAKSIGGNRVLKVEFDMAQRANPGLETSDAGNKYLIDVNRQSIAIKRDYHQAQEEYWRANNHSLDGFQKQWNAELHANPRPLSSFSVAPPVPQGDGTQFVKLPSTAQGGYSWYRQGQDGMTPVADAAVATRLEAAAAPLKPAAPGPAEKVIGGKTYVKQDGNWFEKAAP